MSDRYLVTGGARLSGEVVVGGAKNSVLKLMAAALLAQGPTVLTNVPELFGLPLSVDTAAHLDKIING